MTTPARGMFRAISSFARFCTPGAPGSLHINTPSNSTFTSVSGVSKDSMTSTLNTTSTERTERPMTDTPQVLTPVQGRNDHLRGDTLDITRTASPVPQDEAGPSRPSSRQSTHVDDMTDDEGEGDRLSRSLPRTKPSRGPGGDDAGPRFGAEDASKDSRAKPGEAGHPGIYSGDNVSHVQSH